MTTKNIKITKILPSMAEEIFKILLKNKEHICRFLPHIINNTKTVEDELKFIQSRNIDFDDTFVMLLNKKIIGMIDIHNVDLKNSSAEVGYWISLEYQGKGIVSTVLKLLIDYCKNDLKLKTLFAISKKDNIRSQNVLMANGFVFFKEDKEKKESYYKYLL